MEFKKKVIAEFIRLKEEKLLQLQSAQREQLKDANEDDTETRDIESTREQILDEIGQQSDSIDALTKELEVLNGIVTSEVHDHIQLGSLVHTNAGYFLIATAQNQFTLDGKKFVGLSTQSPLFKKMEGLKNKAEFHFTTSEYIIQEIF